MTSNTSPSQILDYLNSGMSDILPKPFTKEGLLQMLDRHLVHLKTMSNMPSISEKNLQSALTATAASSSPARTPSTSGAGGSQRATVEDDGGNLFNHLANEGLTDQDYEFMIKSLLAAGAISGDGSAAVSDAVGVPRGATASRSTPAEGAESSSAGKKRAAEDSPTVEGDADGSSTKKAKARFTELAA